MKKCNCQKGKGGGLTTILNQETAKQIMYRPFPVNRLNNNVGERPVRGIPYVRDSNYRNMDVNQVLSRDSKFFFRQPGNADTPRLGESLPSLQDGRTREEMKGGAHSSFTGVEGPQITGSGIKEIGEKIVKGVKKVGKFVKDKKIISRGLDFTSGFLPTPLAIPVKGASLVASMKGYGEGQYDRAQEELKGTSAMPRGNDKQSFVATHPLNFNRARLSKV